MNRQEFQQLARHKILDAKALLKAKRWAAAYYLAGYAVECGLKTCILLRLEGDLGWFFEERRLSDRCWTHDLKQLIVLAGLEADFETALAADPELGENWDVVKDWDESSRYVSWARADAGKMFVAITNKTHGVLSWIQQRW